MRNQDHVIANFGQSLVAFGADGNHRAFAGFDLLDVADVLVEDSILGRDEEGGSILGDERDDTVLELGTRIPR